MTNVSKVSCRHTPSLTGNVLDAVLTNLANVRYCLFLLNAYVFDHSRLSW